MADYPVMIKVRNRCPKCGFEYAFYVKTTLILGFGEEDEDELKTPAKVFKCARCGHTWTEFSNEEKEMKNEKSLGSETFT